MKWVCESCSSRNLGSAAQVKSTGTLVQGPSSTPPARLSTGAWRRLLPRTFAFGMSSAQGTSGSSEGEQSASVPLRGAKTRAADAQENWLAGDEASPASQSDRAGQFSAATLAMVSMRGAAPAAQASKAMEHAALTYICGNVEHVAALRQRAQKMFLGDGGCPQPSCDPPLAREATAGLLLDVMAVTTDLWRSHREEIIVACEAFARMH